MASFLPELEGTSPIVTGATRPGVWYNIHDITNDFIDRIVTPTSEINDTSSFIPNMWARIILFKKAQAMQENPLNRELRGLTAALVLRKLYNINVEFVPYDFANSPINNVAKTLYEGNIDSLYFIKINSITVAGFMKSGDYTGFFTSACYALSSKLIPWYNENTGIFDDPYRAETFGIYDSALIKGALRSWRDRMNIQDPIFNNWQHEPSIICTFPSDRIPSLDDQHPLSIYTSAVDIPVKNIFIERGEYFADDDYVVLPINSKGYEDIDTYLKTLNGTTGTNRPAFKIKPGGTVRVEIDKENHLVFEKKYSKMEQIELPAVCIWPNFKADDWGDYYVWGCKYEKFTNRLENNDINIEPMYEKGITLGGPIKSDYSRTWHCNKQPLCVKVTINDNEVGVIPVNVADGNGIDVNLQYEISIDFGTTHTVVARKIAGDDTSISHLNIHDRVIWMTSKTHNLSLTERVATDIFEFMERDFMPSRGQLDKSDSRLASFPTLYKRKTNQQGHAPILDGVAVLAKKEMPPYSLTGSASITDRIADAIEKMSHKVFVEKLKWGHPNDNTENNTNFELTAYIHHLMKLIKAEMRYDGCTKFKIRWAYPIAMNQIRQDTLSNIFGDTPGDKRCISESEAIAYFFDASINSAEPNLIIDIGGGTTDITLYSKDKIDDGKQKAKPGLECSLRFAGNICKEYLIKHKDIITDNLNYFSGDLVKSKEFIEALLVAMPENTLSVLLSLHSGKFSGYVDSNVPIPKLEELRKLIEFAYGAIFYYSGLMLSAAGINPARAEIFCAGNGWGHVDWVFGSNNKYLSNDDNNVFKSVFTTAYKKIPLTINNKPDKRKFEVAKGLLLADSVFNKNNTNNQKAPARPVAGLNAGAGVSSRIPLAKDFVIGEDGFKAKNVAIPFVTRIGDGNNLIDDFMPAVFKQYDKFVLSLTDNDAAINHNNTAILSSDAIKSHVQSLLRKNVKDGKLLINEPLFITIVRVAINKIWKLAL
ncbi:MAG: rod shape-determining protein [Nitrospirae bacterium]|nr:rod shape-determining protein [Nitrospirota bacterium]